MSDPTFIVPPPCVVSICMASCDYGSPMSFSFRAWRVGSEMRLTRRQPAPRSNLKRKMTARCRSLLLPSEGSIPKNTAVCQSWHLHVSLFVSTQTLTISGIHVYVNALVLLVQWGWLMSPSTIKIKTKTIFDLPEMVSNFLL